MLPLGILLIHFILVPLLCLFIDFSHVTFAKMRLQSATDQAVFIGAQILTQKLNEIAGLNQKAFEAFEKTQKEFEKMSKDDPELAQTKIETLHRYQEALRETMDQQSETAYAEACVAMRNALHQHDPGVTAIPAYGATLEGGECTSKISMMRIESAAPIDLAYAYIESSAFDPTGYNGGRSNRYPARPKFLKDAGYSLVQFAGVATRTLQTPFFLKKKTMTLQAASAAQPFGGNIGRFESYRTAQIPWNSLDPTGRTGGPL